MPFYGTGGSSQTARATRPSNPNRAARKAPVGVWFVPNGGSGRRGALCRSCKWRRLVVDRIRLERDTGPGYDALGRHESPSGPLVSYVLDVQWEGCQPAVTLQNRTQATHHVSYYRGNDPSRWASKLKPNSKLEALKCGRASRRSLTVSGRCSAHQMRLARRCRCRPGVISLRYEGLESEVQSDAHSSISSARV